MIVTRKRSAPWSWVALSQLPFAFWMFTTCFQGTAITFSFQKFTANPAVIATTISLASLPVILVAPAINYISDHIWTRFGRRKPFYVIGNVLCAFFLLLMPFAPNYWVFTSLLTGYFFGTAIGKTFFPLSQEIIPVSQRGRGSAIHTLMFQLGILVYYSLVLGRFDDIYTTGPLAFFGPVSGEQFLYATAAGACLFSCLIVALGITELPLPSKSPPTTPVRKLTWVRQIGHFFRDVFDRQWAVLYCLLFSSALYNLGLGSLAGLLYTDQWGYSKQELGTNVAVGTMIILPLTFIFGVVADKFDKMNLYLAAITAAVVFNIAYYLFVTFFLPDHRPALWQIIVFGEFIAIAGNFAATVQWPLIFEYIPRAKIGTASAGMEMMSALFSVLLAPLIGLWVTCYSALFLPPAGLEVRVLLNAPVTESHLREIVEKAQEQNPKAFSLLAPHHLCFSAWDPPNSAFPRGEAWDVRLQSREITSWNEQRKTWEDTIAASPQKGEAISGIAPNHVIEEAKQSLSFLDSQLGKSKTAFSNEIQKALESHLKSESAVSSVRPLALQAWVISLLRRPSSDEADKLNQKLAAQVPQGALLRPHPNLNNGTPSLLLLAPLDLPEPEVISLINSVLNPDNNLTPTILSDKLAPYTEKSWDGFTSNLLTAVNPTLEILQRVAGQLEEHHHLFVSLSPGAIAGQVHLIVAISPEAVLPSVPDVKTPQIPNFPPMQATRWTTVLSWIDDAFDKNGIPLQKNILRDEFMPQRYDYFSAYLATIFGGTIGIGIVLWIKRLERRGIIRRMGVIEDRELAATAGISNP